MPPYAGLDEVFHVARLAFLIAEDREPNDSEKSIPPYLASSIYESPSGILPSRPAVLASFALAAGKWPGMVSRKMQVRGDVPLAAEELHPYFEPNYEAQQPTLYYRIHAPLVGDRVDRTAAGELRTWRRASVVLALITVFATAVIGYRCFGLAGILSAALLVSLPGAPHSDLIRTVRRNSDPGHCTSPACLPSRASGTHSGFTTGMEGSRRS